MSNSIWRRVLLSWHVLLKGEGALKKLSVPAIEIPQLSSSELEEIKHFFPAPKFFIFGHARSGTTLLTRLVRLHPQVHCNYQAHFFTRPPLLTGLVENPDVRSWLARRSNRWNRGGDLTTPLLRAAADFILERDLAKEGKQIVGDKSPNSLLNGEAVCLMHRIYPDARLVFIVRDGRDAVLSHRFQQFIDAEQHLSATDLRLRAEFVAEPQPFLSGERSIFTEKGIRQAAQGWVKNVTETHQAGLQLYQEQYFALRYEDLLRNPFATLCQLWSFLGADLSYADLEERVQQEMQQNPDADWQRQKAAQIVSPLEKGKKGSWRNLFTARDKEIFKQAAGALLIEWGYEKDLDW